MINIKNWSNDLTRDVYNVWSSKYSFWKNGFKIFYSPPIKNPKLMIISYQPGGNYINFANEDKSFFEKGNFKIEGNAYIDTNHKMAKEVRKLFNFKNGQDILKQSVILPLIFFRSPSITEWKNIKPKEIRKDMEQYSLSKMKEVIDVINPKNILVIGFETYSELRDLLGNVQNEVIGFACDGKRKLSVISELNGIGIFASIHLTGARISVNDKVLLRERLKEWIL